MIKLFSLLAVIALIAISSQSSFAQLTGSQTIPGTYATINDAVTALNDAVTGGVGSGGVTFTVAAGYTEQIPAGGFVLNITVNQPTAANQIIFQKGAGSPNPICTTTAAGLGTVTIGSYGSNGDAFFKLNGTDYITFDGIDLLDNFTGVVTTGKIEYGYMLCRASASNGCKNVTIKNCRMVMALNSVTSVSAGIYTANYSSGGSITSATSIAGRHENIFIDGNTIERSVSGMYFDGTTDAVSPYNLYSNNIQVGVTTGNTLIVGQRASVNAIGNVYGIYCVSSDSVKFSNNTIRVNIGSNATTHDGIFTSTGTNSNIDIISNNISDTATATTSQQSGIRNTLGALGTNNTVNIQNNTISNCSYNTVTTATITYIQNLAGAFTINISGNTISNNTAGAGASAATGTITGILQSTSNSTVGATLNIFSNNVNNLTRAQSLGSFGQIEGIQVTSSSRTTNIYSNNVNTITNNTTISITAGILVSGAAVSTLNCYNNTVYDIKRLAVTTSGPTYGINLNQSAPNTNAYGNTIYNIINSEATSYGTVHGYYNNSTGSTTENVYNNTIYNLSNSGFGDCIGAQVTTGGAPTKQIYGNNIYNVTGTGQTGGLITNFLTSSNVYKNRIYNITSNGITRSPNAYGMQIAGGTTNNVYNNYISEIKAPNSNVDPSPYLVGVIGLYINGGTTANIFYNTVYLDAASVGTNFSSAALWSSTTPTIDVRNNIFINKSTPSGTGLTVAFMRSSATLTSYSANSNRNNFYAGTPGANRLIYCDPTNSDQLLTAFKTRVSPKDANSVTDNTAFVNTAVSPYDLHISLCSSNQIESNGAIVSSPIAITDDYDGNARYNNSGYPQCSTYTATAPDIGADEFGGIQVELEPPVISYTVLGNTSSTSNRAFTNVTITDIAGINNTAGTKPRCYFKKTTDANTYAGNTASDNGWKWVEANGVSSPYDFTIDYSIINGGSVAPGNAVMYFVVAQDLAATPNVAINSGTAAGTITNVADFSNLFPLTGTINQYSISGTYSGAYNVGTNPGDQFPTLTGAGGLFAALNGGIIAGNITIRITTDLVEDGTNDLNDISYDVPNANYTLRIVPSSATERVISGNSASGLIRFDGNDYVTIDGNNGLDASGAKYLRFRNTNGSAPTFSFFNDSKRNTITNCIIESNNTNTTTQPGTILFGTTTKPAGNDSNSITDCDLRDRSDAVGRPNIAVYALGTTTNVSTYNDAITISGCNIYDNFNDGVSSIALSINTGNNRWTVTGNSFYQTAPRYNTAIGAGMLAMLFSDPNGRIDFTNNFFGGTAPNCGGSPLTYGSAALQSFMYIIRVFQSSYVGIDYTNITGNTIRNISFVTAPTGASILWAGIMNDASASSGQVVIENNTIGSSSDTGSIQIDFRSGTFGASIAGIQSSATRQYITNNTIGSISLFGGSTGSVVLRGINSLSNSVTNNYSGISNNIVGSNSIANSIRSQLPNASIVAIRSVFGGSTFAIANVDNNTIANLSDQGTGTVNSNKGIEFAPLSPIYAYGLHTNTVRDISSSAANITQTSSSNANLLTGISLSGTLTSTSSSHIYENTVYNLNATNTGANNVAIRGIGQYSPITSIYLNSVRMNRIYGLTTQSTGTAPMIVGYHGYYAPLYFFNNQITLTNGEPTDNNSIKQNVNSDTKFSNGNLSDNRSVQNSNSVSSINSNVNNSGNVNNDWNTIKVKSTDLAVDQPTPENDQRKTGKETIMPPQDLTTNGVIIQGFYDADGGTGKTYYYNTIYVGGNATTNANNSYCYTRESFATTVTMKNNLFVNARTGGTGKHYVINNYSATNWISGNINYNVYLGSDTATIGRWVGTDQTIAQWRTSSVSDKQTWSTTTASLNPSNLFTSISTGNLGINTANQEAWIVSGKGIALTNFTTDYNGDTRNNAIANGTTDIGSDEFGPLSATTPTATVDNPPGSGVTSTYTLWGRSIAQVVWSTNPSGTFPTSLDVYYNSGVNPPNTVGGNFSNSHTIVNANGGPLTGATYNITYYFGDNETYTISTPSASTILAKYGISGIWVVYHLVQPSNNSVLTYNTATQTYTVSVLGLDDFSTFALTDDISALPVTLESFDITVNKRDATVNWVTSREINNKGFGVERRVKTAEGYSNWKEIIFVNGNGTSNERHVYTHKDLKMLSGAYQYRLKQVDFNGNYEYHSPSNNADLVIGKPGVFDISQNYPNPSNPTSNIDFQMPFDGKVSLRVYDILGKEVATLVDGYKTADFYTAKFDGTNLSTGVYFYRIIADNGTEKFTKTLKMILVK